MRFVRPAPRNQQLKSNVSAFENSRRFQHARQVLLPLQTAGKQQHGRVREVKGFSRALARFAANGLQLRAVVKHLDIALKAAFQQQFPRFLVCRPDFVAAAEIVKRKQLGQKRIALVSGAGQILSNVLGMKRPHQRNAQTVGKAHRLHARGTRAVGMNHVEAHGVHAGQVMQVQRGNARLPVGTGHGQRQKVQYFKRVPAAKSVLNHRGDHGNVVSPLGKRARISVRNAADPVGYRQKRVCTLCDFQHRCNPSSAVILPYLSVE